MLKNQNVVYSNSTLKGTPETRFSEPQFSEILNLVNKLQKRV